VRWNRRKTVRGEVRVSGNLFRDAGNRELQKLKKHGGAMLMTHQDNQAALRGCGCDGPGLRAPGRLMIV
jgi:hypothetical protein